MSVADLQKEIEATRLKFDEAHAQNKELKKTLASTKQRVAHAMHRKHGGAPITTNSSAEDVWVWMSARSYASKLDQQDWKNVDGAAVLESDHHLLRDIVQNPDVRNQVEVDFDLLKLAVAKPPKRSKSAGKRRGRRVKSSASHTSLDSAGSGSSSARLKSSSSNSGVHDRLYTQAQEAKERALERQSQKAKQIKKEHNRAQKAVKKSRSKELATGRKPLADQVTPAGDGGLRQAVLDMDTIKIESTQRKKHYWCPMPHENFYFKIATVANDDTERENASFRVVPALVQSYQNMAVSFESLLYDGAFLIHEGLTGLIKLEEQGTDAGANWKRAACFRVRPSLSKAPKTLSFEAVSKKGYYICSDRNGFALKLAKPDKSDMFAKEASFKVTTL